MTNTLSTGTADIQPATMYGRGDEGRPPLLKRTPGRAARIAALHALADWFAANPDLPIGDHFQISAGGELTLADVQSLADRFGTYVYPEHDPRQMSHDVDLGAMRVTYIAATHDRERPL